VEGSGWSKVGGIRESMRRENQTTFVKGGLGGGPAAEDAGARIRKVAYGVIGSTPGEQTISRQVETGAVPRRRQARGRDNSNFATESPAGDDCRSSLTRYLEDEI
jgi:hypothetical protein